MEQVLLHEVIILPDNVVAMVIGLTSISSHVVERCMYVYVCTSIMLNRPVKSLCRKYYRTSDMYTVTVDEALQQRYVAIV